MAMKLAFSTVACPDWTIERVVEQATAIGYQGVELRTLGPGSSGLSCDPALGDPEKIGALFRDSGIEPVCLSTSVALHHRDESAARAAHWQVIKDLELAAGMGCGSIRIFGSQVGPGESLGRVIGRIADRVAPLAELAGQHGIELLFENSGSLATAKPWWWLLGMVDHPMLGLAWNVANAAAAGELASVSVPTLHSKIRLAKIKDANVGAGSGYLPLGEGTVGVETFLKRLLGVGFDGYVCVEWDRLWLGSLEPAEQYLPEALSRITGWVDQIAQAVEKGRAAANKAAAKNAPKPRLAAG